MTRRWISALLASLVLANLVAWPSAALAEILKHDAEVAQFDGQSVPVEPAPAHCPHGCIGHYGQHFQWHTSVVATQTPVRIATDARVAAPSLPRPQTLASPPFRPPLGALIRS